MSANSYDNEMPQRSSQNNGNGGAQQPGVDDPGALQVLDDIPPLPEGVTLRDQQEDALLRMLMSRSYTGGGTTAPSTGNPQHDEELARRLRDFQFAQQKRRQKYGTNRPLGIFGLYDHLSGIRTDVEWAEDAAWRRFHSEPYLSWSDFEECKNSGFNKPFFVWFTLAFCTIMLVVSILENGGIESASVNPMIGPSAETLIDLGAKQTALIVDDGEIYRLFSPMVLHAGVIHYIVNMFVLWFIGTAVERCHGTLACAILFILPAVGGTILSAIFLPEYISVGASGGIFGLIGACLADIVQHWSLLFNSRVTTHTQKKNHRKVLGWLIVDVVINCVIGLTPFVDNFTHMAGLIYGYLCGLSTMERLRPGFFGIEKTKFQKFSTSVLERAGIIACVVCILISLVVLLEGDGKESCSWCRYLSCAPMPFWAPEDERWWYCDDCATITGTGNKKNGVFVTLSFTCPDGVQQISQLDISDDDITNVNSLTKKLPGYCRDECDNIFA